MKLINNKSLFSIFLYTFITFYIIGCGKSKDTNEPNSEESTTIVSNNEHLYDKTHTTNEPSTDEDSSSNDSDNEKSDEESTDITLKKEVKKLINCYNFKAKPNAKKKSKLCINKLLENPDKYFKSTKIYVDKIPAGIDIKEIMLYKQPVNIAMETGHYDHTKWKDYLVEKGLPENTDAGKSFYTKYYEKNKKLAPNIALYCKTPILDETDPKNFKTHDMGGLSVSGFGFDSNKQPDWQYFLNPDGIDFKPEKEKEFKKSMSAVFEKNSKVHAISY